MYNGFNVNKWITYICQLHEVRAGLCEQAQYAENNQMKFIKSWGYINKQYIIQDIHIYFHRLWNYSYQIICLKTFFLYIRHNSEVIWL